MLQISAATKSDFLAQDMHALITERVRGEFREMPGLTLTVGTGRQAMEPRSGDVRRSAVAAGLDRISLPKGRRRVLPASDLTGRPLRLAARAS